MSKGISQESLAFKANTSLSQVGRIERGKRSPTLLTIFIFAMALEVSPSDLMNFSFEQPISDKV